MQTQDAPADILFNLWPWLEKNKNRLIGAGAAVIVLTGIYYFISAQREQNEIAAGNALTQLLLTPSGSVGQSGDALVNLAAKYNGTEAGKRALLQGAASLYAAERYADAQAQFQKYLDANAGGPLGATAQLGLGSSLEAQGKNDLAVAAYQRVVSGYPGSASALPAYCALGRIAEQQGKLTEALNNYQSAAHVGYMGGTLAQAAAMNAQTIQAKIAATKPAPAKTPAAISTSAPSTLVLPAK